MFPRNLFLFILADLELHQDVMLEMVVQGERRSRNLVVPARADSTHEYEESTRAGVASALAQR